MGFMDKAKAAAEQAKTKAKEGVEDVQAKKELAQAYWDLGHKTHELASRGAISNPELDPLVQRITELEARGGSDGMPGTSTMAAEPPPTSETVTSEPTAAATATASPAGGAGSGGSDGTIEPEQATHSTPPQSPA